MKRRHSMQNGGMNQNRNRQQGRYNNGGGNFQNRPRKNFPALREKYLNMAKDAMGSGDRVLAEYYLQHADHYYRMQAEFMADRQQRFQHQQQQPGANAAELPAEDMAEEAGMAEEDVDNIANSNALPSFITQGGRPQAPSQNQEEKVLVNANWEEE